MTDRDALLAACAALPDDDTPRLVLADWLDDHDDPTWAEFIRLGVELARGGPVLTSAAERLAVTWRRYVSLQQHVSDREPLVLRGHLRWGRGLASECHAAADDFVGNVCRLCMWGGPSADCDHCGGTYEADGFAGVLFRRHPAIQAVTIVGRRPLHFERRWLWHNAAHPLHDNDDRPLDHLPGELFTRLKGFVRRTRRVTDAVRGYRSEDAALDALNAAALDFGREQAALYKGVAA